MKAKEVTLKVFKQYLELIGFKLIEMPAREQKRYSGMLPPYYVVDNLGNKTGHVVNEELIEINTESTQTCFWLNECWVETIEDDSVSLTTKKDNSGIFITFSKQISKQKKK